MNSQYSPPVLLAWWRVGRVKCSGFFSALPSSSFSPLYAMVLLKVIEIQNMTLKNGVCTYASLVSQF
jgi:hypothetical protein